MERKTLKPCLPSLIMGNVRSLRNKMEELTALTPESSGIPGV